MFAKVRNHVTTVIAVVMAVWFCVVAVLAVAAFFTGFTLPEADPLSAEQKAEAGSIILALAVVLVLPPAAATAAGVRFRHPVAATLCGLITVIGLAGGAVLVPSGLADIGWKPSPVATRTPQPGHCIERSGGDTRCPGG